MPIILPLFSVCGAGWEHGIRTKTFPWGFVIRSAQPWLKFPKGNQQLSPCAAAFMALFGRDRLPVRSTLSRFLAALSPEPVEALPWKAGRFSGRDFVQEPDGTLRCPA